jgi:hypothetical protein
MKKYRILKTIVLGFIEEKGHGEQYDALIDPRVGIHLECDGTTIWLVNEKGRHESTTIANLVEPEHGHCEEIPASSATLSERP